MNIIINEFYKFGSNNANQGQQQKLCFHFRKFISTETSKQK